MNFAFQDAPFFSVEVAFEFLRPVEVILTAGKINSYGQ